MWARERSTGIAPTVTLNRKLIGEALKMNEAIKFKLNSKIPTHTQVDVEDVLRLSEHSWTLSSHGYAVSRKGNNKQIYLHRFLLGEPKGYVVDHINGDKLDNRKSNLRTCSIKENIRNMGSGRRNKSNKYRGVSWATKNRKWVSLITVDRRAIYLGLYESEEEAAKAYDAAAALYFGSFARLNFPKETT